MEIKGQAAMEFLMTYGWAILVVLIAIGALAYFGVLSPQKFLPKSCIVSPGFSCEDTKVTTAGIDIILRNGLGKDLTNVGIIASGCTSDANANGDDAWNDGTLLGGAKVTFTSCTNGAPGSRFSGSLGLSYTDPSGLAHNATISLKDKVE